MRSSAIICRQIRHRTSHGTILIQRKETNTFQQLTAGQVAGFRQLAFFAHFIDAKVQSLSQKVVSATGIARIVSTDYIDDFVKISIWIIHSIIKKAAFSQGQMKNKELFELRMLFGLL